MFYMYFYYALLNTFTFFLLYAKDLGNCLSHIYQSLLCIIILCTSILFNSPLVWLLNSVIVVFSFSFEHNYKRMLLSCKTASTNQHLLIPKLSMNFYIFTWDVIKNFIIE